jgi:conjugal transfer mating pair stabilization protein TraG
MDSVIYTYGGGDVLWSIFNGIAMVFKSESPYWTSIMPFVAGIGGLWAATVAISKGNVGIFAKTWFAPTFLLTALLFTPKTTVHISDLVDRDSHYHQVKDVPVGLALIASTSSVFASSMTEMIETLFPTEAKYSGQGPAFAARLMAQARHVRIKDPIMIQNVKDFTRQCFWWPFIAANVKGLRSEARQTSDILSFVEQYAHPSHGIYWRESGGRSQFLYCKEACPKVRQVMRLEGPQGLRQLTATLSGKQSEETATPSLVPFMQDAWKDVAKHTADASQAVEQQMMVNAYRAGLDDHRESLGMMRMSPELLSYSTTRAMAQQNTGFWIKGEIASTYMPMMQVIFFALLLMAFILILPFVFMPGGLSLFGTWIKLMLWVQTWPMFSAILNAIFYILLKKAGHSILMGTEGGFSIETTTALADAAENSAAWMSGFQLSIPVLAWAFISKGGYALTQLAGSLTAGVEGMAGKIGSDVAEGNLSVDNQSFMNRTIAGHQIAQQSFGANQNFASSVNDGAMTVTRAANGEQIVQQHTSQLKSNVASKEDLAATASTRAAQAQALTAGHSQSLDSALSEKYSKTANLIEKASQGLLDSTNISSSENQEIRQAAEETKNLMEQYGKQHGLNAQTMANMALEISNKDAKSLPLQALSFLGIKGSAGVSAQATNQESLNHFKNSDEGKRVSENIALLTQHAKQHQSTMSHQVGKDASTQYSASEERVKTATDNLQRSYTNAKNWETAKQISDTRGLSTTTNENDAWLSYVANQHGTTKEGAARLIDQGGASIEADKAAFVQSKVADLERFVSGARHELSEGEINAHLNSLDQTLPQTAIRQVEDQINQAGFRSQEELQSNHQALDHEFAAQKGVTQSQIDTLKNQLQREQAEGAKKHQSEQESLNLVRMGKKAAGDVYDSGVGVVKFVSGKE